MTKPSSFMIIENLTRQTVLVSQCGIADAFFSRFKGLMGVPSLKQGEGLLIVPSNAIHTHFMRFPIDVLYLDRSWKVVGRDENMKPWRMGRVHPGAYSVLELPAGAIAASGTQVGDRLSLQAIPRYGNERQ